MIHLTSADYVISRWSGGATAQIAIAPEGAEYAQRDFLWRISSATVELEQSEFTALPDYDRWIATLKGSITLTHNGGQPITLDPCEAHFFDGGDETCCLGRCTDFNLMLRKGKCRGSIRGVHLVDGERETVALKSAPCDDFKRSALLLFCGSGQCTLTGEGESLRLAPGESVLTEGAVEILAGTATDLMAAEVWF